MPNPWFQFKQFMVKQEKAAMKVGTDGVLLGAWASVPPEGGMVLDVGTGTGLISLMIAQRSAGIGIDAIDIDALAIEQAGENFQNSPWKERLHPVHASLQSFAITSKRHYDLVVCNPPFFSNSLKPSLKEKTMAKHDDSLGLEEIFSASVSLMKRTAFLSLILPAEKESTAQEYALKHPMYCFRKTWVIPTPGKKAKRVLLEFSLCKGSCLEDNLWIETGKRHEYSEAYKRLTGDFYREWKG